MPGTMLAAVFGLVGVLVGGLITYVVEAQRWRQQRELEAQRWEQQKRDKRMADLLALQPNMNIKLHIVAPYTRRDKVFQEIQRPVFSLLDEAPLSERCTFLSYDSIREIADLKQGAHLADSVLDDFAEEAE